MKDKYQNQRLEWQSKEEDKKKLDSNLKMRKDKNNYLKEEGEIRN